MWRIGVTIRDSLEKESSGDLSSALLDCISGPEMVRSFNVFSALR